MEKARGKAGKDIPRQKEEQKPGLQQKLHVFKEQIIGQGDQHILRKKHVNKTVQKCGQDSVDHGQTLDFILRMKRAIEQLKRCIQNNINLY